MALTQASLGQEHSVPRHTAVQLCEHSKSCCTVPLKRVSRMVNQLYLFKNDSGSWKQRRPITLSREHSRGGSSCERGHPSARASTLSPQGRLRFTCSHISQCIFHLSRSHSERCMKLKHLYMKNFYRRVHWEGCQQRCLHVCEVRAGKVDKREEFSQQVLWFNVLGFPSATVFFRRRPEAGITPHFLCVLARGLHQDWKQKS